jgi:putative transposase
VKYAFIESNHGTFCVSRMCEIMGVSPSAYYDWLKRPVSARSLDDRRLGEKVKKFHEKSRETYGARRIREDLVEDDELINRTRVGRLMKLQGLKSKVKRKFKATTNSNHGRPVAPNLLDREFQVDQLDIVYAGDITYIPTD